MNAEQRRLEEDRLRQAHWRRWGPYLSERQWGTVREDYSATGEAWDYFPHDHARSRTYRWGEDGLLGISDNHQRLCFALALWNGRDAILKERAFGLTGSEGNHGEDVKEYYFYLDSTPTHSWMTGLYKYPQAAFPYANLLEENRRRGREWPEYELLDTGVFQDDRYFDVHVAYAKANGEDVLVEITATNRGPEPAPLHLLPTMWFRNTWAFGGDDEAGGTERPQLRAVAVPGDEARRIDAQHPSLGAMTLVAEAEAELLFCDNETNFPRLFHFNGPSAFPKDGIGRRVVNGERDAVNPARTGTKAAAHFQKTLAAGETWKVRLRLARTDSDALAAPLRALTSDFDGIFDTRLREADEFYDALAPAALNPEQRRVQRQALAGMLWNKQFYHYVVDHWLDGDPGQPPPPAARLNGRNHDWRHLFNDDILSLPDTWEFPWFASWDLAFHTLPLALVDPEFAKRQLMLLTREWYMHPNGQLPAYEWAFGDVNPPVHAWAAWRVFTIERKMRGDSGDLQFLERVFQKLLLNFTWWVNRK
ncbi:MAG: glucosidase, partial [Verrucomicrobia bacterium]|nr:glucosidase [Verrucomicrobiota bacterium]